MKAPETGEQLAKSPGEPPWTYFCDFQDISHVVLEERCVRIHLQDNKCLVGPPCRGLAEEAWACPASLPDHAPLTHSCCASVPALRPCPLWPWWMAISA